MLWRKLDNSGGFVVSRLKTGKTPRGSPLYYAAPHRWAGNLRQPIRITDHPEPGYGGARQESFRVRDYPPCQPFQRAREYLAQLGTEDPDADAKTAGLIWMHALAIAYSEAYLSEIATASAATGRGSRFRCIGRYWNHPRRWASKSRPCWTPRWKYAGVTCGKITPVFKTIGQITKAGGGQLDAAGDDSGRHRRLGTHR